jgi:hypothetical protein
MLIFRRLNFWLDEPPVNQFANARIDMSVKLTRWSGSLGLPIALFLVATPTFVWICQRALLSLLPIQLNSNEGWNAYWALQVSHGQPLYPAPSALVLNNYPPLSFLVVSTISRAGIDALVVGRALSWVSILGCAYIIFRILKNLQSGTVISAFAALLFLGLMATQHTPYVGMYDPQITGHFIMLIGLSLLLGVNWPSGSSTATAAFVMVIGGFFKHNLIALPLAVTIWLALFNRRLFWTWLFASTAALSLGFMISGLVFGQNFFVDLLSPRLWSLRRGLYSSLPWIEPLEFPLFAALLPLFQTKRDPKAYFIALYAGFSLLETIVGAMGDRVSRNAVFDTVIISCLGMGYALSVAEHDLLRPIGALRVWLALACSFSFILATAGVTTKENISISSWNIYAKTEVEDTHKVVELLKSSHGQSLCQDLILCYWAHKPMIVDLNAYVESVKFGQRDYTELVHLLDAHYFSVVQFAWPFDKFEKPLRDGVLRNYVEVRELPGVYQLRSSTP